MSVLFLIAALAVVIRIPFLWWPLISDEGGYAYTAHWWSRGCTLYSTSLWLERPQGLLWLYRLGMAVLGGSTWAIRLWGALWAAAAIPFVYGIVKRLASERAGLMAAFLCAVFAGAPQIEGFTANSEVFLTTLSLASAYCALRGQAAASGVLASAAMLIKPSGAAAILLGVAWLALEHAGIRKLLWFVAGALVLPLAALAHGALTVGWRAYLYAIVGYGMRASGGPEAQWLSFLNGSRATWMVWLPLGLCALGCAHLPQHQRRLLAALVVASFLGMAAGGHWFEHYFVQIVPALTIAAAVAVDSWRRKMPKAETAVHGALVVVGATLVAAFACQGPADGCWRLYSRPGYLVAADVAAYLRNHTDPTDQVYVAFTEADIYHLAGRRSCIAQIFAPPLFLIPGAYAGLTVAIQHSRPVYVLALDAPWDDVDPERRFWQALEANYHVETMIRGFRLYRRNQPPAGRGMMAIP